MSKLQASVVCLLVGAATVPALWAGSRNTGAVRGLFERVFGDATRLDGAQCRKVLESEPGKRHYVDADGDGDPEEVWFVDSARRHPDKWRPVLVRVIDEDGDLEAGVEPDLDSDLYVADWKGDGVVDAVCDYTDRDGDEDVDEMGFYFPRGKTLMVWWSTDVGDDNLLWYDIGYTYTSRPLPHRMHPCEYRTHFGGDELFCSYVLSGENGRWSRRWENPFAFYDRDDDGVTEEVIRITGSGSGIETLRHSFDADDDATRRRPRDFDVSVSAHAREGLTFGPEYGISRILRGIPAEPSLRYRVLPVFARKTEWADYMLTWVEDDLNMDGENLDGGRFRRTQERWEGVIGPGNEFFKQIGGPSVGLLNKRLEVAMNGDGPLQVYYSPTDQRIHLHGADKMWMGVDFDYDHRADMRYEYLDRNKDGYVDTWTFDLGADGIPEDRWTAPAGLHRDVDYCWADVNAHIGPVLESAPKQLYKLDVRLMAFLRKTRSRQTGSDALRLWNTLESGFGPESLDRDLRVRLLSSNEAVRFYLGVLRDALIAELKKVHKGPAFWKQFAVGRARGDWNGLKSLVEEVGNLRDRIPPFSKKRAEWLSHCETPQLAWARDWVPGNIGWESREAAYRAYRGHFSFFGKKEQALILPGLHDGVNYHREQRWGMDALHVGDTCGLGGVTLYVNSEPHPVHSSGEESPIEWSRRLVSSGPEKLVVELKAENVGPTEAPRTVRFRCTALPGRRDSSIDVLVHGGEPGEEVELGIGLTRLPTEDFVLDTSAGVMACWGSQGPQTGTVGLGIVFPPDAFMRLEETSGEHRAILQMEHGRTLRYHIQGTWLRGRRFSRCPTVGNWVGDLRRTAARAALR